MSRADNLTYRFPRPVTVSLADGRPFPDEAAFHAEHEAFVARVRTALEAQGHTDVDTASGVFHTGGAAAITYRAVRWGDDEGGAELVLHEVGWPDKYESLSPWISLYGTWSAHQDALASLRDAT